MFAFGVFNSSEIFPRNDCLYVNQLRRENLTTASYINTTITLFLAVVLCPATVFLNALVIFCVSTKRRLRKRNSNIYLLLALLAVTDLAEGAIGQPVFIARQACQLSGYCDICLVRTIGHVFSQASCLCSLFHLVMVAVDRVIAIKFTLRYQTLVTTTRIARWAVIAWLLSISLSFFTLYYDSISSVNYFIVASGTPCVLIVIVSYIVIYCEVTSHKPQWNQDRLDFKAVKTTAAIIVAAFVCFGVAGVLIITAKAIFDTTYPDSRAIYRDLTSWGFILLSLNSLLNPIIYAARNRVMWRAFKQVLCQNTGQPQLEQHELVELPA